MAAIKKRGPYQWQARIRRKGWPVQTKTFSSKADAQAWAREIENEMDRRVFISRKEAENTTLEEALQRYREEYIPRLAQPKTEYNRVRQILRHDISSQFLATIRTIDINDYIKFREKEVRPKTIRLELSLLSRLFEVAASDWGMESLGNPVKRATKPKLPKGRERRLKEAEEEKLLEHCFSRLRPVILFALETAMRRGEIAELTWENVDLKRRKAHLPATKNGEARDVPLSSPALTILKELIPDKTVPISGNVFGISKDRITHGFWETCQKAGIEDLRFHDLRHEATSRLFENTDLDVMEIRAITGHKNMQMLARYSHLRTHRLADRLDGAKRGASRR
ncbi:MAG: tyrosine-type recombinase/integrase [Desulfobia sp.]